MAILTDQSNTNDRQLHPYAVDTHSGNFLFKKSISGPEQHDNIMMLIARNIASMDVSLSLQPTDPID